MSKGHYIAGKWLLGEGAHFESINPADQSILWTGNGATQAQVDQAFASARAAFGPWAVLPLSERVDFLAAFVEQLKTHHAPLSRLIATETGKPLWEAKTEVDAMIGKLAISREAYEVRTGSVTRSTNHITSATCHRPHGVVGVLGPFNFPGHLPNGHIIPALLAGNTIVFKPSEYTPLVSEAIISYWHAAGLPAGVLNLLQGGAETGRLLSEHKDLNGLFFTGSYATGVHLHEQFAGRPAIIVALEMGGNNPLIVTDVKDIDAASYHTLLSAYLTSGQRCTCARRLIVPKGESGDAFIDRLATLVGQIRVGANTDEPEPFMGPVISSHAAKVLLQAQTRLIDAGGQSIVNMQSLREGTGLLSPGLIDVTPITQRQDEELFGPLLQLIRVDDFAAAIQEANHTRYGLSAGLLSDNNDLFQEFFAQIRAGIVNWNRPLTGASSAAPFGGIGRSGNHHPSAYYASDYCAYPVASQQAATLSLPQELAKGIVL